VVRETILALLAASVLLPWHVDAQTLGGRHAVIATGDSYTRRSPCTYPTYDQCDRAGLIIHELSYPTYLNAVSRYQVVPSDNSARGGETCTTQAPYPNGPWAGQNRGLLAQVDTRVLNRDGDVVSVTLGVNDINVFNVSPNTLAHCLQQFYDRITAGGKKLVVLTYPPSGNANVDLVNDVIRSAVRAHNAVNPSRQALLAETSSAWSSADMADYLTTDNVHPNEKGARQLARTWAQRVCGVGYLNCYP
jgi:hypothetical protein